MSLSRRKFLSASIGVSTAAFAGWPRACAADDKPGSLIIGIQSYSLRNYPVDEAIKISGELGFKSIEFYSGQYPINSTPEQISEEIAAVRRLTDRPFGVNLFAGGIEPSAGVDAAPMLAMQRRTAGQG